MWTLEWHLKLAMAAWLGLGPRFWEQRVSEFCTSSSWGSSSLLRLQGTLGAGSHPTYLPQPHPVCQAGPPLRLMSHPCAAALLPQPPPPRLPRELPWPTHPDFLVSRCSILCWHPVGHGTWAQHTDQSKPGPRRLESGARLSLSLPPLPGALGARVGEPQWIRCCGSG